MTVISRVNKRDIAIWNWIQIIKIIHKKSFVMKLLVKSIFNCLKRLMKFDADSPKLVDDLQYQGIMTVLKANYARLLTLIPLQEDRGKGLTLKKQQSRLNLFDVLIRIVDLLKSYGFVNKFDSFTGIKNCSSSQLRNCSAGDLIVRSRYLSNLITAHATESVDAGVTPELNLMLTDATSVFSDSLNMPKDFRIKHHDITMEIDRLVFDSQDLLKNGLLPYMRSTYQKSDPELYQAFVNSIEMDAIPTQQRALQGKMINAISKEPLKNVKIFIDDNKPIVRGGEKGVFYIQNLLAGEHTVRFELKAFQTFENRILVLPGITYELNVELMPNEIEEPALAE